MNTDILSVTTIHPVSNDPNVMYCSASIELGKQLMWREFLDYKAEVEVLCTELARKYRACLVKDENFIKNLSDIFISDHPTKFKDIISFLKAAIDGDVLDLAKILTKKSGNIKDVLNRKYINVFYTIIPNLLKLKDPTNTRGSSGSGELMLVMLSKDTIRLDIGDIRIQKFIIELKSSLITKSNKESGGRLTSKTMPKNKDVLKNIINPNLMKFFGLKEKDLTSVNKNGKKVSLFHFNITGINHLNKITENLENRYESVHGFLKETIPGLYPGIDKIKEWPDLLDQMVNSDGSLSTDWLGGFFLNLNLVNFIHYKQTDKFDRIMFFNIDTLEFIFIETVEDFKEALLSKRIKIVNSINWDDSQNTPSMQFYFSQQ
jgi:hypothetical protein